MDVFNAYAYGSSAWLALKGFALLGAPKLVVTLLVGENRGHATELEIYLSRSFGLALLAIALLTIMMTGSIPLTSQTDVKSSDTEDTDPRAPYAFSALLITTLLHGVLAFYDYAWYISDSQSGLALGMVGSTIIAAMGVWCILFGTTKGRVSRKTGADKRTSGFPFKNAEADKRHAGRKAL
ncbi:hypothetical protein BGW36DRAFT_169506 [Talaromyces proteolyticus]|uniref:Uncharacterized protein n=1 Tax=Talaromyces proteolyticus TaxID=1131652 RepID=A0AAD4KRC8_9EURO|nr:uncharacterized protein BGW36DRAFT_169506 [Talaromyces proteolyticus]KAH8697564.1 hypothetical protein BGW36DRAFT_169506 [Talaromyces proteolyticus]